MSRVGCNFFFLFVYKVVELIVGGSVINGATPSSSPNLSPFTAPVAWKCFYRELLQLTGDCICDMICQLTFTPHSSLLTPHSSLLITNNCPQYDRYMIWCLYLMGNKLSNTKHFLVYYEVLNLELFKYVLVANAFPSCVRPLMLSLIYSGSLMWQPWCYNSMEVHIWCLLCFR